LKEKRAVKIEPPCENTPCEFFRKSEWSSIGPRWGVRWHCDHPDHPDNPRAHPDEKCPKLIESVGLVRREDENGNTA